MAADSIAEVNTNEKREIASEDRESLIMLLERTRLNEAANEILNRPAKNRNFRVRVDGPRNDLTILLRGTNEDIDMREFSAEGYRIKESNSEFMSASPRSKEVLINPSALHTKGGILSLLHEFGHTFQSQHELSTSKFTPMQILEMIPASFEVLRVFIKHFVTKDKTTLAYDFQNRLTGAMPTWWADQFDAKRAEEERNAWAYALKTARVLEKRGFNVLGEFDSVAEVKDFVKASLIFYESDRFDRTIKKKSSKNYEPKFVKLKPISKVD